MSRVYSSVEREILVILKRGLALTKTGLFDACRMASKEQIAEQLERLIQKGKVQFLVGESKYRYIAPTKTMPAIVDRFVSADSLSQIATR